MKKQQFYFLELKKGDDVRSSIINFVTSKNLQLAQINAIGMLENVTLGFWNEQAQNHDFKHFPLAQELITFSGNIMHQANNWHLHAHAALSNHHHQTIGGHFGDGKVAVIMQCFITEIAS